MKYYKAKKNYIVRQFADETVLVPMGEQMDINNSLIILNETSVFLWELLSDKKTFEELVTALINEYEAEKEMVTRDVEKFIISLLELNALETVEE